MTDHTAEPVPSTPADPEPDFVQLVELPEWQCSNEGAHAAHLWWTAYEPGTLANYCPGFVGRAGVPAEPLAQGGIVTPDAQPRVVVKAPNGPFDSSAIVVDLAALDDDHSRFREQALADPAIREAYIQARVDAAYERGKAEGIAYAIKVILDQAELGEDVARGDGTKMLFVRGMRHAASCAERMAQTETGGGQDGQ